ncbi:amidase [Roseomonas sp. AR75]|uniref:amidase n=1 Tax=Roseomonas sp. AR75 TaxID=2562311 RepID=UPI0014858582|nr:amidase [Roseomonas sp. AR75]
MSDLAWLGAGEGARRIAAGTLTAERWTEALLARCAALQPAVAAWITLDAEGALAAAREADRTAPRGSLHGVPVGLKDCIDTAGLRTTGHSRLFLDRTPSKDAAIAARLRQAGAVILGKHAMYELSYGGPSFDLPFPPARNPWDPARIPGGSSSGSAAAVASGQGPVAVGTDAGGSIRQPAAYCGVVGLKPTLGLVSREGVLPMTFTMGEAGPMARNVEDCALLLDAIAGTRTAAALGAGLAGARIGVLRSFFDGAAVRAADAVIASVEHGLSLLASLGARVSEASPPSPQDLDACGRVILLAEAYANHEAQLRADPTIYGTLARHRFVLGAFLSAADLLQAQRRRMALARQMDALFDDHDLLLCAAEVSGAPRFDDAVSGASFPFVSAPSLRIPFNLTGHPALSLPAGFDADGMPLALQIIGRRGEEGSILAAAAALEARLGVRDARPPRFG